MVITNCLHAQHLMRNAIRLVLHLVDLKEQEAPGRLDIEVNSRAASRCKGAYVHYKLARKTDAHVDEYGSDDVLVSFASWLVG